MQSQLSRGFKVAIRVLRKITNASENDSYYLSKLGFVYRLEGRLLQILPASFVLSFTLDARLDNLDFSFRPFFIDELYMSTGLWEPFVSRVFKPDLGNVVIDAGANIGYFTLKASQLVGPEGLVISVEPDPRNFKILSKNVSKNRLSNVKVMNIALGDKNSKSRFTLAPNPLVSELTIQDEKANRQIEVEVMTLDKICDKLGIRTVDWLKIDVERGAYRLLRGSEKILRNTSNVIIEAPDRATLDVLRNERYSLRRLQPSARDAGYYFAWRER